MPQQIVWMLRLMQISWQFMQNRSLMDTSNNSSMDSVFDSTREFNQSIDLWDTSKVTRMPYMFNNPREFNQPIDLWSTSKVTTFEYKFYAAESFNQCISTWDFNPYVNTNEMLMNLVCENIAQPHWEQIDPWCNDECPVSPSLSPSVILSNSQSDSPSDSPSFLLWFFPGPLGSSLVAYTCLYQREVEVENIPMWCDRQTL